MEKNELLKKIKTGYGITHPATFHADDILSACLLRLINPDIKIIRSDKIPEDENVIVFDIGLGAYDHHQENSKIRENGIKYAAFGLLWKDLSFYFMDDIHAKLFDEAFIQEIDRCDNGPDKNLLSSIIGIFNPTWNGNEDADEKFEQTVSIFQPMLESLIYHFKRSTFVPRYCKDLNEKLKEAFRITYNDILHRKIDIPEYADIKDIWESNYYKLAPNTEPEYFEKTFLLQMNKTYGKYKTSPFILGITCLRKNDRIKLLSEMMKRKIISINALSEAKEKCEEIYQKSKRKDIIIFDQYIPNDILIENHESIKAVIFPSNRGGYTLKCANLNQREKEIKGLRTDRNYPRFELPQELRGKSEEVLRKLYKGLFFVHQTGFMASFDTEEEALNFYNNL